MEIVIFLLLIGAGIYLIFKINIKNGAETVRAFMYLYALSKGVSPDEARRITDVDVSNVNPQVIRDAMDFVREQNDGKQLPLIRSAYEKGMLSRLPKWYRSLKGI